MMRIDWTAHVAKLKANASAKRKAGLRKKYAQALLRLKKARGRRPVAPVRLATLYLFEWEWNAQAKKWQPCCPV